MRSIRVSLRWVMVLACVGVMGGTAWYVAGQAADVPLPPGAMDELEARLAARRAAQGNVENPVETAPITGGRGGRNGGRGGEVIQSGRGFPSNEGAVASRDLAQGGVSIAELKKLAPVFMTNDANQIESSDKWMTVVIPVRYADAVRLRMDLSPLFSNEADLTANSASNSIVVTDTGARLHHILQIVKSVDELAGARPAPVTAASTLTRPTLVTPPTAAQNGELKTFASITADIVDIQALIDGRLAEQGAAWGATVKGGELLFRIDTHQIEAEHTVAQTRVEVAKVRLREAEAAGNGLDLAKAQLAAETAVAREIEGRLSLYSVVAPCDGIVAAPEAPMQGDIPGLYVTRGTTLARVIKSQEFNVDFRVLAKDAPAIHVGQEIIFTANSDANLSVSGKIVVVSPLVEHVLTLAGGGLRIVSGGAVGGGPGTSLVEIETVEMRGKIIGQPNKVVPGMSGSVSVKLGP